MTTKAYEKALAFVKARSGGRRLVFEPGSFKHFKGRRVGGCWGKAYLLENIEVTGCAPSKVHREDPLILFFDFKEVITSWPI